jgi:hypothetical protein
VTINTLPSTVFNFSDSEDHQIKSLAYRGEKGKFDHVTTLGRSGRARAGDGSSRPSHDFQGEISPSNVHGIRYFLVIQRDIR